MVTLLVRPWRYPRVAMFTDIPWVVTTFQHFLHSCLECPCPHTEAFPHWYPGSEVTPGPCSLPSGIWHKINSLQQNIGNLNILALLSFLTQSSPILAHWVPSQDFSGFLCIPGPTSCPKELFINTSHDLEVFHRGNLDSFLCFLQDEKEKQNRKTTYVAGFSEDARVADKVT